MFSFKAFGVSELCFCKEGCFIASNSAVSLILVWEQHFVRVIYYYYSFLGAQDCKLLTGHSPPPPSLQLIKCTPTQVSQCCLEKQFKFLSWQIVCMNQWDKNKKTAQKYVNIRFTVLRYALSLSSMHTHTHKHMYIYHTFTDTLIQILTTHPTDHSNTLTQKPYAHTYT